MSSDGPTFGLWYDFQQRPPFGDYARLYAECLEVIEEGEELGYAGVSGSQSARGRQNGYLPSPLAVAAALAARTERMTIGTNVLLLPMHHPLRVAEDAAVVDLVSPRSGIRQQRHDNKTNKITGQYTTSAHKLSSSRNSLEFGSATSSTELTATARMTKYVRMYRFSK